MRDNGKRREIPPFSLPVARPAFHRLRARTQRRQRPYGLAAGSRTITVSVEPSGQMICSELPEGRVENGVPLWAR